jgi:small subunit ribosomal protein S16
MLKIKLARFGKKKQPMYRIVVNEARDKRDGRYVESIGQYAPTLSPKILDINLEAYQAWLKKGAQPTDTVASLVKRLESGNPFPERAKELSKKAKAKAAAAAEEAATAAATPEAPAEVTEEPATEAAAEPATPEESAS